MAVDGEGKCTTCKQFNCQCGREETGWLIETKTPTGRPCYWAGPALWTIDHLRAIRFARKIDGERVAEDLDTEGLAVVEHMWSPVKLAE